MRLHIHCYSIVIQAGNAKGIEAIEKEIYDGHILIWGLERS